MKNSMKQCVALVLMMLMVFTSGSIPVQAAGTWVGSSNGEKKERTYTKSDDSVLEVAFISITTDNYPKAEIKLEYRIDEGSNRISTWTYDGTQAVSKYIAAHPEYKNRKIKMSAEVESVYAVRAGIHYGVCIKITINGTDTDYYYAGINMWENFPDDFIDYDAFHIAAGLKLYKQYLYDAQSMKINGSAKMGYSSGNADIVYFKVPISAKNRMGGYTTSDIGIVYNEKTGKIDIINLDDYEYVVRNGAHSGATVWDEARILLGLSTQVWASLI